MNCVVESVLYNRSIGVFCLARIRCNGEWLDQPDMSVLLYTHSPESSRITVNCSCDTEQDHEDTMMGSHPGDRVTAYSVRCSILEYLMEMMVIFISLLGSVSLGSFP
ncbi:hypothetical protein IGI04_042179, partial [Brassica rapa subsp. trilocularis]